MPSTDVIDTFLETAGKEARTELPHDIERLLKQRYYRDGENWPKLVDRIVEHVCEDDESFTETARYYIGNRIWLPNSPVLFNSGKKNGGLFACQPGWARVHTQNGFITIEEIVKGKLGPKIPTYWGSSEIINWANSGYKNVLEIETEKGYRLYVTGDHGVYRIPREKNKKSLKYRTGFADLHGEWDFADSLELGDMLVMPVQESQFNGEYQFLSDGTVLHEELAEFVAYLQADGHLKHHRSGSREYLSKSLVCEVIVDSVPAEERFVGFFPSHNIREHDSGVRRIRGYGNDYDYLLDICDYGTYDATIPEVIYKSPRSVVAGYIRGWFDAEGTVTEGESKKGHKSALVSMTTCSEDIARGLQFLLKAMGIISSVYFVPDDRENRRDRWMVTLTHKYDQRHFLNEIGFINPTKQAKLESLVGHIDSRCKRRKEHFVIKSITDIGKHPVYDISTTNETYISDGFVVHNCFVVGPDKDTLEHHVSVLGDVAMVGKRGGGCGFTGTFIREKGAKVAGSAHGYAYGPNAWALRVSDYLSMVTQSGARGMALMYTLRTDHPDLDEFIDLKQTDDEKFAYNFNQSIMATDAWMQNAADKKNGEYAQLRRVAKNAWNNGDPGLLFHTTINENTPYSTCSCNAIEASNPCGEVPLPSYGSCNLGSINLAHEEFFNEDGTYSYSSLARAAKALARFLDNVGMRNVFPNEKFEQWYEDHRPIGVGVMGFADACLRLGLTYGKQNSLSFLGAALGVISSAAIQESERLGRERGIPEHCGRVGRRNITVMSIAPTGSIGFIAGCSHGIEPIFSPRYQRTDERGETYMFDHPMKDAPHFVSSIGDKTPTWKEHIDVQSMTQAFVDSAVSKTVNMNYDSTVDDVYEAMVYAWRKGCKGITVYRDGSRQFQVLEDVKEEDQEIIDCPDGVCLI